VSLAHTVQRIFNTAYRPAKAGIGYDKQKSTEGPTKKLIEGLGAVLILYASYSELTDKILKTFSIAQGDSASLVGRMITCIFGVFVCLHIVFAKNPGSPTIFAYSKLQRLLANLTLPLILVSLGMTTWQFFNEKKPILGQNESYFDLPAKDCVRKVESGEDASKSRTYICAITIPNEAKDTFKDIKVFVTPVRDYVVTNVVPVSKDNNVIKQSQEPLKAGGFGNLRWEWVFPEFNPTNEWKIKVTVESAKLNGGLTDEAPIRTTVYLYK
jgi:hypothetical protein